MVSKEAEHVHISFTVRDSGVGIDNDKIDRLFQTFSQLQGNVSGEKYEGTGLGLSICKQLVELMSGRIWLEQCSGRGSTFMFEMRLAIQSHKIGEVTIKS